MIAESKIAITLQTSVRSYRGRSHSLWYCDPFVESEFSWYEVAFMRHAFGGQPEIVPFALSADEARIVFEPVMGNTQIVWPFQEIDRSDPMEFLGRWLGWFAQAAAATLQQPMSTALKTFRDWGATTPDAVVPERRARCASSWDVRRAAGCGVRHRCDRADACRR